MAVSFVLNYIRIIIFLFFLLIKRYYADFRIFDVETQKSPERRWLHFLHRGTCGMDLALNAQKWLV
jgi:hypothetical protein